MRKIDTIVIHHSTNPDYKGEHNPINVINRDHKRLHEEENLWGYHIAYHHVITRDGELHNTRPYKEVGYHAGNYPMNLHSIGICLDGNFMKEEPTQAQLETLKTLIIEIHKKVFPIKEIIGHRDCRPTACPGDNLYKHILTLNSMPELIPPKPQPEKNITLEEYIHFFHKVLPYTADGKNDCTMSSLSANAITHCYFMYQKDISEYRMNGAFVRACREFLEKEAKPYRSPGQTLDIGWLMQKMQEYNKTISVKEGEIEYSFTDEDIYQIKVDPKMWHDTYFSKGIPVALEINSWAYTNHEWHIDPTPSDNQIAVGHVVSAFYREPNGDVLVYDKNKDTHVLGFPKGVKRLKASFAERDAKGHTNDEGVSRAWVITPDYFPNI